MNNNILKTLRTACFRLSLFPPLLLIAFNSVLDKKIELPKTSGSKCFGYKKKSSFLFALILFFSGQSFAEDLLDVYRDAMQHDPTFQAALSQKNSDQETLPQAYSFVLPQVRGTGSSTYTQRYNNSDFAPSRGLFRFGTHSYEGRVTQPLFHYGDWERVRAARSTYSQAENVYRAAAQSLMTRTSSAYFAVLQAKDTLRFTTSELRANERQLDQAKQRFKVGLDAITSVYNAQAEYDAVLANKIKARNDVLNALEALRQITGHYYKVIAPLRHRVPLIRPEPHSIDEWVATGLKQNFNLLASEFSAKAAHDTIKANAANRYPVVDLVGRATRTHQGPVGFGGDTDTQDYAVGVEISFPVFQGGLVFSQKRQAGFNYQTSLANLEGVKRDVINGVRQSFNNIMSGISKIRADRQAIKSAQSSLSSSNASLKVGTRTIVDVLDAQKNLYDAQRVHAADEYAYINDSLKLKEFAGTLSIADLEQINSALRSKRSHLTMERFSGTHTFTQKIHHPTHFQRRQMKAKKIHSQRKRRKRIARVAHSHKRPAISARAHIPAIRVVRGPLPKPHKPAARTSMRTTA